MRTPYYAIALLASIASPAYADPQTSVRADALADTQQKEGIVVVQGNTGNAWLNAEALIWTTGSANAAHPLTADAQVAAILMRDPHGVAELRLGRFVFTTGAIRPVQIDGAAMLVRAPWGTKVEAMAGAPVVPAFGPRDFDWIAGGRISQLIASRITVGISYVQRRQGNDLADEEVGADLAATPLRWLDLAARANYDISSPGISEALASAAARAGDFRFELFASDRSPSRLLPDTSLFSVFGDFAAQSVGANIHWKAAPRLDVWLTGAGQAAGGVYGGNGTARARLKLDDKGDGNIGVEIRRQDVSTARWTGARIIASEPITRAVRCSAELEVVVADDPQGKGAAWPWGLLSVGWHPTKRWEIAAAVESASTPEHSFELNALARLSLFWSTPR